MAIVEAQPPSVRQEPQISSQKQEPPPHLKKRNRRKKVAIAGLVLATALSVGGRVALEEAGFSEQKQIAPSISATETYRLKGDLQQTLQDRGLLGDPKKPLPIEVVTFNTASGNEKIKTPQGEFVNLPFYKKVIKGEPDAPIIGLQEAGPAQVNQLEKHQESGNFSYIYKKSKFSEGGNLLIVPKRFEVLKSENTIFSLKGQALGTVDSLLDGDFSMSEASQIYPRMLTEATLKDRFSGRVFTVFNTHLSYADSIQYHQEKELFAKIKAKDEDAIILTGDLNADTGLANSLGKRLKQHVQDAGLADMEQKRDLRGKTDIDYVLAKGFTSLKSEHLFRLALPGFSTAEQVSDHYAEADVIQFTNPSE